MKKILKLLAVGAGVMAIVTLALGTTVFADSPRGTGDPLDCTGCGGYGFGGEGIACNASIVELLDLTADELCELRAEGLSLADIAASTGLTLDELIAAVIADRAESLQTLVDEGVITPEQRDYMLERMAERIELMLTRTATGPAEWGMGYAYGRCNVGDETGTGYRWENRNTAGACTGEPALFSGESNRNARQCGRNR
ncbi:MAG: hypothetical protein JW954_02685 [Dehalococcoidaceae bacterium]|nr:hypothetical protein [Dehalococcoidaceae bacterium]